MPREVVGVRLSPECGVAAVAGHVGLMLAMKQLNVNMDIVWQAAARNEAALGDWQEWEPVFLPEVHDERMSAISLDLYSKTALVADQAASCGGAF